MKPDCVAANDEIANAVRVERSQERAEVGWQRWRGHR
jgi:hypothetical protein